ncbi:MAG: UDP-2,3-diacylglucosamine hydrolase [Osedax symbiont Rs2]|nr:MAG: UDP-2,3-diacylglucosamine hydrolase [Osedax symbiont Rs2]
MTVLFVADLHLCAQRPDLIRAFIDFLEDTARGCEALYLLGDIFEAWIGDDYIDTELQPVLDALSKLSQDSALYFQQGNRDFLAGTGFTSAIGAQLLDEQVLVQLPSQQALIMHGDQLCTDDIEYQKFRTMVRSSQWQQQFLSKSIDERLQIAEYLRTQSKQQGQIKSAQITDVNLQSVQQAMNKAGVTLLIHGHTHRPATHKVKLDYSTGSRIVLGDWDRSLWYLRCDPLGCNLIEQKINPD